MCVFLIKFLTYTFKFTFSVYVFVGEHSALIDFLHCMQQLNLLQNGLYMVISVDDEIYDPTRLSDIIGRGKLKIKLILNNRYTNPNISASYYIFDQCLDEHLS